MSSRRQTISTIVLVVLVLTLGYVSRPYLEGFQYAARSAPVEPPLPGENSISNLVVRQDDAGQWQATLDYYYTGAPRFVAFKLNLGPETADERRDYSTMNAVGIKRGANSMTIGISYPGSAKVTREVVAQMVDTTVARNKQGWTVLTSARVDQVIDWPDWQSYFEMAEFAQRSSQQNLNHATELIDAGREDSLAQAKSILERLIERDPTLTMGYIELARVAMKSNWGPEGLHHAEGLLSSALQIQPDNVNAKVLMAYVYTHQKKYKAAEKLFAEAAAVDPPNLWLWANWGELYAMQGRFDESAAKYREAVQRPMTHDTYDRARSDAYINLLRLLERKKDFDGMDSLYQSSVTDFGSDSCFSLRYANFLVERRGQAARAIELARKAIERTCNGMSGRQTLGLAQYVMWSQSEGAARAEALNQARIYLPPGPAPMYLLARNDKTADVVVQLVAAGEKIDQKDNENLTALGHAVQNEDLSSARRLLRLGAKPTTTVGYGDVPVALMPVMSRNVEMIKLMQQFGADYGKLSYNGSTAFEFAKQTGDAELSNLLSGRPQTL
jgi:tetratricopeptide (TPR) repeat protein